MGSVFEGVEGLFALALGREQEETLSRMEYRVLKAMLEGASYGYAIRGKIAELLGVETGPSLPSLYTALDGLKGKGMIKPGDTVVVNGRERRTYVVAGLGSKAVSEFERRAQAAAESLRTANAAGS
jgi:DNA-binding PadR family transcriptional regulator